MNNICNILGIKNIENIKMDEIIIVCLLNNMRHKSNEEFNVIN